MSLYDGLRRSNSEYIPQFIGSNAEPLLGVSQELMKRSAENQNALDDVLAASVNEKYAPGDEHIGHKIYKNLDDLRNNIASSDEGFENSAHLVRNAVRSNFLTNTDRINALRNADEYYKYLQDKAKLGSEGVDFTPKFNGTVNEDGTYNMFKPQLEKRLDYDQRKESFFNQFQDNLRQSGFAKDANNPAFLKSIITGGIHNKDIENYLNDAFNRYKTTGEYNQEFRKLKQETGLNSAGVDEFIQHSILSTGLERVHGIRKEDLQTIPEYALKGDESPYAQPTSTGAAKVNPSLIPYVDEESKLYTDNGKKYLLINKKTGKEVDAKEAIDNIAKINLGVDSGGGVSKIQDYYNLQEVNPNQYKTAQEQQHAHISSNMSPRQQSIIRSQYPNGYGPEQHKIASKRILSSQKAQQVVESGEPLTEGNRTIYENRLKGDLLSAPSVLEGESKPKTLRTIIDELNLGDKDKFEIVPSMINYTSPNQAIGTNLESVIYKNGRPFKSVQTRLHDQAEAGGAEMNDILQNSLYSGIDKYTKEKPKISDNIVSDGQHNYALTYYTTTIPDESKEYPFDTEVHMGLAKVDGINTDGSPKFSKPVWTGESLPAREFQSKFTNIIKKKLSHTYGSGQMHEKDLKALVQ